MAQMRKGTAAPCERCPTNEEVSDTTEGNVHSTLVVLTTGKEAFVRANAVLQMTLVVRKTTKAPVELQTRPASATR